MKSIAEILPVYGVEKDMILSKMGDMTVGYALELPEILTMSGEEYETFHQAWVKAIKILPAGTVVHKQDWFMEAKYKADFSKDLSFLSRSSERFFNERPYLDHSCYLFLTKKPADRQISNSALSTLLRKHIVPIDTLNERFAIDFLGSVGQFERILCDSGFVKMKKMNNTELSLAISKYLNLGDDSIVRDISFEEKIKVGEKHCELFTLADAVDLPAHCGSKINYAKYSTDNSNFSIGFAAAMGQLLSCNHIYSQYIFIEDSPAVLKKLESKKLRLQSLSAYSRENAIALDATNEFLNEAIGSGRLPVKAHFNVLAWTDNGDNVANLCSSAFSQIDATAKIETVGAPQIYWAGIPGNAADFPINDTFQTFLNQACCFLNLETNYRSSQSPYGMRLSDRVSGRPLHVDLSDEPMEKGIITNRNKIIIGPSGSGKSFLTNHANRSGCELGSHIVVIDMGNSYKGLCEMLKGYYFTYSENNPIRFNPFYVKDALDTEKKESIKTLLVALWKKENESFYRSEYVALSNALQMYYDKVVEFRCFNSFYDFLKNEFSNRLEDENVKAKEFDLSNFLYVLRPYYKGGEFDYLLNASENLELMTQPFIVFEIDNIKDHPILFPVVTIIIMELFIAKMRKLKGVRKIILIEEAWKAIANAGMAEYAKYLYKTVRKYFGEAHVVTQDIEDILNSEIIKQTIINNADCKILMDMSKYQNNFDQVQQLLGLTDKEKTLVLSLNKANDPGKKYKEVFISLGGKLSKVYRVEVSPEENYTYTTEEKEKIKVLDAQAKYGSMEMGIRSLVLVFCLFFITHVNAQIPIIGTVIAKVIKAIDLKIQKLQNQTLVLQNVQKEIENNLHKLKLQEISDWSQRQKDLYANYFTELKAVKQSISKLSSSKNIASTQLQMIREYKQTFSKVKSEGFFSDAELQRMNDYYLTILNRSLNSMDALQAANSNSSLGDAGRLDIVNRSAISIEECLAQIREYNITVLAESDRRRKEKTNISIFKQLNGLP